MKFHELAVGDKFTIDHYGECEKISPTQYRTADGRVRRTSGTANVNGPSGDKARNAAKEKLWDHTRAERRDAQRKRWNDAARASGFESWSDLLTQLSRGNVTIDRKAK